MLRIATVLALVTGPCQFVAAQLLQVDANSDSLGISWDQHRFRGVHAVALYSDSRGHDDWLAGAGYKIKSWLLGRGQNFYVSTGAALFALKVDRDNATSLVWHSVLRYEPRRWQEVELAAVLDYGPPLTTQGDGEQVWGASIQMDYRLSDHSAIMVGWRRIRFEPSAGDKIDVALGSYVGVSWLF